MRVRTLIISLILMISFVAILSKDVDDDSKISAAQKLIDKKLKRKLKKEKDFEAKNRPKEEIKSSVKVEKAKKMKVEKVTEKISDILSEKDKKAAKAKQEIPRPKEPEAVPVPEPEVETETEVINDSDGDADIPELVGAEEIALRADIQPKRYYCKRWLKGYFHDSERINETESSYVFRANVTYKYVMTPQIKLRPWKSVKLDWYKCHFIIGHTSMKKDKPYPEWDIELFKHRVFTRALA